MPSIQRLAELPRSCGLLLLACLGQACGPKAVLEHPSHALSTPQLLEQHVRFLAEGPEPRSWANAEGLERASGYIAGRLRETGGAVTFQDFTEEGLPFRNVCASYGPTGGERIIVGAHYDVCDELPGADDNASGVAALIEVGRALGAMNPPPAVDLVAYSLEEPPFFGTEAMGSAHHARSLAQAGRSVRMMICLEMVGYFSDEPDSQDYPLEEMGLLYPTTGNFIAVVGRESDRSAVDLVHASMARVDGLPAVKLLAPPSMLGMDFSDHRNYWEAGMTAVMVTDTAFFRNPHYHTAGDRPETLDYERMSRVVDGVVGTLIE